MNNPINTDELILENKDLKAYNDRYKAILTRAIIKHNSRNHTSCSDTCMIFGLQGSELNINCGDCYGIFPDTPKCLTIKPDKLRQIIEQALKVTV